VRPPRFRTKDVSTCMGSPTARGPSHASHVRMDDVAFPSTERGRHLGIRPVSQLNTQPIVAPVNASRQPSRTAAHHSGPERLARPFSAVDFHLLSLASLSWRPPSWVKSPRFCRVILTVRMVLIADARVGHSVRRKCATRRHGHRIRSRQNTARLHPTRIPDDGGCNDYDRNRKYERERTGDVHHRHFCHYQRVKRCRERGKK